MCLWVILFSVGILDLPEAMVGAITEFLTTCFLTVFDTTLIILTVKTIQPLLPWLSNATDQRTLSFLFSRCSSLESFSSLSLTELVFVKSDRTESFSF